MLIRRSRWAKEPDGDSTSFSFSRRARDTTDAFPVPVIPGIATPPRPKTG